LAWEFKKDSQI